MSENKNGELENKEDRLKSEKEKLDIISKVVDFIFSSDERKWLILIFVLGVLLRFLVANNISALGDEMVHGPHAIGFLHSGLISTLAQSPLWFYLTDIAFKIFGVTMFSTRFLSFFYGSLSILLLYSIGSSIFNKKTGLISAFLLSVSFFTIRYTLAEMDLAAIFFLLLAVQAFMISVEKNKFPYLAAIAIGIAVLIKTLSLFFVPTFLIGFFLFNEKKGWKKNIKNIIYFGLLILLFFSPILIHNYLWYKDKGMVDTYFAQYFDIGNVRQAYSGQSGYASGILFSRFFEGVISMSKEVFFTDPLITILGIFGVILLFLLKDKKNHLIFLLVFEISGFVFLILSNWLPTHYTTMVPVLSIFGGFFIEKLSKKFKNSNRVLMVFLLIILGFQIYLLLPHLTSRCGLCQMRDYAVEKMDKNSVVVADARIYRGRIAWLFNDFHYLESTYLPQMLAINENITGENLPVKVYFIECVKDDCGWGTVTAGQLNDTSEELVKAFSSIGQPEKVILGGGGYDDETGKPYFKIYQTTIGLKPQIIGLIDSTHEWFYYPVNYEPKEKIWDNYNVNGFLDNLIFKFAWLITILSIALAISLPIKIYKYLRT